MNCTPKRRPHALTSLIKIDSNTIASIQTAQIEAEIKQLEETIAVLREKINDKPFYIFFHMHRQYIAIEIRSI